MLVSPPLSITTNRPLDLSVTTNRPLDFFQTYWDNNVAGSAYLGEGRTWFAIIVISLILSQNTVV